MPFERRMRLMAWGHQAPAILHYNPMTLTNCTQHARQRRIDAVSVDQSAVISGSCLLRQTLFIKKYLWHEN
jgi:hypothetical protein